MSEHQLYTVSILKRVNVTVRAASRMEALAQVATWWPGHQPIDGNVLLGVIEGTEPLKSGLDPLSGPQGKPPSGPTPGTPTINSPSNTEAVAA